ncbi:unnamed protein product [Camellia sinensis]
MISVGHTSFSESVFNKVLKARLVKMNKNMFSDFQKHFLHKNENNMKTEFLHFSLFFHQISFSVFQKINSKNETKQSCMMFDGPSNLCFGLLCFQT